MKVDRSLVVKLLIGANCLNILGVISHFKSRLWALMPSRQDCDSVYEVGATKTDSNVTG